MSSLENKNIIVTGASGGIGNAIIKKLSEAGANILASGTRIEKLEELNIELIPWGVPLTEIIKSGKHLITI